MSLFAGGTSAWTKANILTTPAGAATLGVGVGGADGLTTDDVTTLITNLSGDVSTGGMRSTSSWGFDTTNAGSTFTVADVIANTTSGSGGAIGVTKLGTGTLSLTGTNTFTRGVRIEGGVLTIGNTSALGSGTGYLQFAGGTLDLATFSLERNGGMTATAGGLANGVISGTGGLTKTGPGTFRITATDTSFTGATSIQEGVVEVAMLASSGANSSLGAPTTNATIGLISGTGIVTGAIGGAGMVSPGNSPGILTAGSLDPSANTDFIFEITGTAPDFGSRDASTNDVLRLTDLSSPFASSLTSQNVVNVLFNLASGTAPVVQGTYKGGFFTDAAPSFSGSIANGSFTYWVSGSYGNAPGDQQQFAVGPGGSLVTYSRLGAFDSSLSVTKSVVSQSVGAVNGQITQFVVVPEPATLLLAGVGTALLGWRILRRRRAA